MQNLDPDMDDLLRRASEAYPLKEGKDRWEEIASKMMVPTGSNQKELPQPKRTYKALAVLFTLLFLTVSLLITERGLIQNSSPLPGQQRLQAKRNSEQVLLQEALKTKEVHSNVSRTVKKISPGSNALRTTKGKAQMHSFQNESQSVETSNDLAYNNETTRSKLNPAAPVTHSSTMETIYSRLKTFPGEPVNEKAAPKIIKEPTPGQQRKTTGKRFYFGATVAVSFSTVKNSGMGKTGYGLGLLGGFRFTRSISLETGLLYSRKFYSSKGDYFDMNDMGSAMPSGMQIMEVDGSNHVFEVPLHLKFDFYPWRPAQFYSTIGFSSFLMTQEKNQYDLMTNGVAQKMTGTYKNIRQYMAASLDLSIGYEKNLGPVSIRLEPYVQIPLKGVGIGKLPVTSFGWRLGLLH
jgi:hypothetical protein